MDAHTFDRVTRALAKPASRRGVLALGAGAIASRLRGVGAAPAAQAGPSTCGSAGDVCTMLLGCCSGLTCVTSAINVNYGVCVTGGDGGTVASGTSLISPFSESLEQEIGTIEPTDTTAIDDREAELEQRKADKKARRDARQSKRKSRNTTQQSRREDKREDREFRKGPKLETELSNRGGTTGVEAVRVRNREDTSVLLTRIESLLDFSDGTSVNETLSSGQSFSFYSGPVPEDEIDADDEIAWRNLPICDGTPGAGFRIFVGFSSSSNNREYEIRCDGSDTDSSGGNGSRKKHRKRKKKRAQSKNKGRDKHHKNK